jgi:Mg-chelatase subunit ChlD
LTSLFAFFCCFFHFFLLLFSKLSLKNLHLENTTFSESTFVHNSFDFIYLIKMFTCGSCNANFGRKGDLLQHLDELPAHRQRGFAAPAGAKKSAHSYPYARDKSSQMVTTTKVTGLVGGTAPGSRVSLKTHQKVVKTTTVVSEALQTVLVKERHKLVFSLVQDASGSMAGSRIDTSLAGLNYMFEHVFHADKDFLGVVTYNSEVTNVHRPMPVRNVDKARDMAAIRNSVGGRTATYDALGSAITDLKNMHGNEKFEAVSHDAVYQMLLVTDGDDNSSRSFNLDTVSELVRKPGLPNFHLHVIAVQMGRQEKAKLERLCGPGHCTFYQVEDLARLGEELRRVGERVLERVMRVQTTETVVENTSQGDGARARAGAGAGPATVFNMTGMGSALDSKAHFAGGSSSRKVITNGHPQPSHHTHTVEQSLLKLLRDNRGGIMGAHMAMKFKEAYHRPLQLGSGRKLKEVLLATNRVKLVGGDGPGDKLFMLKH